MPHVIDGAIPLLRPENLAEHEPDLRRGGITAVAPTVASLEGYAEAMTVVRAWHACAAAAPDRRRICTARLTCMLIDARA